MKLGEAVHAYFAAFESGDAAAWADLFAVNGSLGGPAHEPPIQGRAALAEAFGGIVGCFRSLRFDIVALHVHGLHAVAVFRLNARANNGRAAEAEGMVAFAAGFDGRFTQVAGFWDPAPVLSAALGA